MLTEKKYSIEQAICLLETKVNELTDMYNETIATNIEFNERITELERLMDIVIRK